MKLTKILREKTIKELDMARNEANKKARADYEARQKNAEMEIEALIDGITPAVVAILEKYGMDTKYATDKTARANGSYNSIITLHDREIRNKEEWNALRDEEQKRYKKQEQLIEDFAIECELGVEKANFLDKLAELCKKISE